MTNATSCAHSDRSVRRIRCAAIPTSTPALMPWIEFRQINPPSTMETPYSIASAHHSNFERRQAQMTRNTSETPALLFLSTLRSCSASAAHIIHNRCLISIEFDLLDDVEPWVITTKTLISSRRRSVRSIQVWRICYMATKLCRRRISMREWIASGTQRRSCLDFVSIAAQS